MANIPTQMQSDWDAYFADPTNLDKEIQWGGGTLKKVNPGMAFYNSPQGSNVFRAEDDLSAVSGNNPGVFHEWYSQYGYVPPESGAGYSFAPGALDSFRRQSPLYSGLEPNSQQSPQNNQGMLGGAAHSGNGKMQQNQSQSTFDASTDTTRGQVDSMLQQDSEYLQNARTGAMQQANARGLLNSSIAATAGEKAGIDAATLIGDATANQYQKAKLTTEQLQSSMDVAQLSADTQKRIADLNASVSRDNAQLSADTANTSGALSNYRSIADTTNQQISAILTSPSLTPEAKQQAIDSTLMRHDEYLSFSDAITGYDLSSMISYE